MTSIKPVNNELNDPELPNYSDDSEYSDSY